MHQTPYTHWSYTISGRDNIQYPGKNRKIIDVIAKVRPSDRQWLGMNYLEKNAWIGP